MSVVPSGRIEHDHEGHPTLVITREFQAPIEDVWASVTEPARLERWIGTFTGDPASGSVMFAMTAESEDAPAEEMQIVECEPPRLLAVKASTPGGQWHLRVALTETDGRTLLTFTQPEIDPTEAESVGPGWEFYLDRLVAAETGGDVAAIDFERDYYPAMVEHYRAELAAPPGG
jgi:uncharacterized protein YndB with AHSA1/START domain